MEGDVGLRVENRGCLESDAMYDCFLLTSQCETYAMLFLIVIDNSDNKTSTCRVTQLLTDQHDQR